MLDDDQWGNVFGVALGMFATSSWLAETWLTSLEASGVPVFDNSLL